MVCDNPYRAIQGGKTFNGTYYPHDIIVPCGQCPICKKRRVSGWLLRLEEEDRHSFSSYFVTLTYDEENLPYTENKLPTLDHKHFQKFMKKLRKCQKQRLKYYMCGEYGSVNERPHYHLIIFNLLDTTCIKNSWNHGSIHIGQATSASVTYTASYINKAGRVPVCSADDRKAEYSTMSNELGRSFITPEMEKYYQKDPSKLYVIRKGGKKIPLPRYYRNLIFTEEQRKDQAEAIEFMQYQKDIEDRNLFIITNPTEDYDITKEKEKNGRFSTYYRDQTTRNNHS